MMEKVKYRGCGDPGSTLDKIAVELDLASKNRKLNILDARQYFAEIESGKRPIPESRMWEGSYASFDEYKKDVLAVVERREADRQRLENMLHGAFPGCLSDVPDIAVSGRVCQDEVDRVVVEMRETFGTELSEDYISYLAACGTVSICGIGVTGIDHEGEYHILDVMRDMLAELGIKHGYYPLSVIDSDRFLARYLFQDKNGYVYGLLRDGTFIPVCQSLCEYMASLWYEARRGWV